MNVLSIFIIDVKFALAGDFAPARTK
jgi:hypothetical protein